MAFTERYVTDAAAGGGDGQIGTPWTLAEALTSAVAGDRVNILSDSGYSLGADAFTNAGTVTAPILFRGYNSSIGDLDNLGRNADGTLNTTNMPDITLTGILTMNVHCILQNLDFTGALSSTLIGDAAVDTWSMLSCRVINTQNNASARSLIADVGSKFINCDFSCTGAAHSSTLLMDGGSYFNGCRFETTSSSSCISVQNGIFIGCSFFGNGSSDGIAGDVLMSLTNNRRLIVDSCTFQGIGRAIVTLGTHVDIPVVTNCHITDNSEYFDNTSATTVYIIEANNRLRDNTTPRTGLEPITINEITTAGSAGADYNDAGSNDFRLKTTAPGYEKGMTPFTSIGAAHVAAPASGGGGGKQAGIGGGQAG